MQRISCEGLCKRIHSQQRREKCTSHPFTKKKINCPALHLFLTAPLSYSMPAGTCVQQSYQRLTWEVVAHHRRSPVSSIWAVDNNHIKYWKLKTLPRKCQTRWLPTLPKLEKHGRGGTSNGVGHNTPNLGKPLCGRASVKGRLSPNVAQMLCPCVGWLAKSLA